MLAEGPSAQIPLNKKAGKNPRARGPDDVKPLLVSFAAAAQAFAKAQVVVEQEFLR
jgi:hypothetical protein